MSIHSVNDLRIFVHKGGVCKLNQIGPILILEGANFSKVPYSRSLYLNCSEKVLIDTGAEARILQNLNLEQGVQLIINTHYHPDHTLHNHLFQNTTKLINPIEFETSLTIEGVDVSNSIGLINFVVFWNR